MKIEIDDRNYAVLTIEEKIERTDVVRGHGPLSHAGRARRLIAMMMRTIGNPLPDGFTDYAAALYELIEEMAALCPTYLDDGPENDGLTDLLH